MEKLFPKFYRFSSCLQVHSRLSRSCECPFTSRCCSWATLSPSVPSPGNSAHYLRLPPTSQRPVPSLTVMSVVSGFLPAAHTFLHNKNALILRPSWPFKLSVPRGGHRWPQRALFSCWYLLNVDSGLPPGPGVEAGGSQVTRHSGPLHTLCIAFEETEAQRGQEIHSKVTESVVEVKVEAKPPCMAPSPFTP